MISHLMNSINYWAILVTSLLSMALGFLWMSVIWRKPFMKYMYGTMVDKNTQRVPAKVMIFSFSIYIALSFITSLMFAFCLDIFRDAAQYLKFTYDFRDVFHFTLLLWLGFFFPFSVAKVIWQFKSWRLVFIEGSYELLRAIITLTILWFWY